MELLRFLFLRATQDIFVGFFRFRGVGEALFFAYEIQTYSLENGHVCGYDIWRG